MRQPIKLYALPLTLSMAASPALADHQEENSALQDAWLDGKLDAVVLLNEDLNPFEIDTDVVDGMAIVTGNVSSDLHRNLLNDLALSIDGINSIDNQLHVEPVEYELEGQIDPASEVLDASISTAVATKLLLNSEIDSSRIDVDTSNQTVILEGRVGSDLNSNLAEQIARSTFEVQDVHNRLIVVK